MHSWGSKLSGVIQSIRSARSADEVRLIRVLNPTRHVQLADRIEIADQGERRRKGLLGRQGLAAGEGLWIVPCEAVHTFGMRFAIDLVYLNRSRRIVKIRRQVPPGRFSACLTAHSVIELPAGSVRENEARVGDTLEFEPVTGSEALG